MTDDDTSKTNETGVSRRATLTLAAGVAALGLAIGMRSNAFAQGKGEGKMEGKGEGKAEGKAEGKGEGKGEGKEGRREGKAGRIRVDIDSEGATTVDVKCSEDEPMRACGDLTKEIVDKIRAIPTK
jgi:flagellar biosynthesis/type III secretory pathway protein FliH